MADTPKTTTKPPKGETVLYRSGGTDVELAATNVREDGRADLVNPDAPPDEEGNPVVVVKDCPQAKEEPVEGHWQKPGAAKEHAEKVAKEAAAKEKEKDKS
jgi:hypothetical protein